MSNIFYENTFRFEIPSEIKYNKTNREVKKCINIITQYKKQTLIRGIM